MNNISDVIPAEYEVFNSRLEEASVFKEEFTIFLKLRYRYKNKNGEIHDLIFTKVNFPFKIFSIPRIQQAITNSSRIDYPIRIETEAEPFLNMDENGNKIINKTIGKEMTLDEISKALGYNVVLKEDDTNE